MIIIIITNDYNHYNDYDYDYDYDCNHFDREKWGEPLTMFPNGLNLVELFLQFGLLLDQGLNLSRAQRAGCHL